MKTRINTAKWYETKGLWIISVQKDGKRKQFSSSKKGRTGQREANAKADMWLENNIESDKKLSVVISEYIEKIKLTTSQSNWKPNVSLCNNWIIPYLGNIKMSKLSEGKLQNCIDNAFEYGDLSEKTLKNLRACLNGIVKYARRNKYTNLIVEELNIPKTAKKSSKKTLQPEDLKVIFSDTSDEWYKYAFRFNILTGLRPGELLALRVKDIKDGILTIHQSINKYNEFTKGKNENAARSYPLTDIALNTIKEQRLFLKNNKIISPYLFCDKYGEVTKLQNYEKHLKSYIETHNLTPVTPYELRHTFISINKSIPQSQIAQFVGHCKDMDTYGVYGHIIDGEQQIIKNSIEDNIKKYIL